jgi:hypothetical protein
VFSGRTGNGAAVAGLPLATALTAAAQGWTWLVWLSVAVFVVVMAVTFAPWIPWVRDRLPVQKRIARIERAWADGRDLFFERVSTDAELDHWILRHVAWREGMVAWLDDHVSAVDAARFRQGAPISRTWTDSYNGDHDHRRLSLDRQLDVLLEIRDELKAAAK